MTEQILLQNYNTILDCWKLLKENHDIGQGKDYDTQWEEVKNKSQGIYKKYNTEFARQLTLAVVVELEYQSKLKTAP